MNNESQTQYVLVKDNTPIKFGDLITFNSEKTLSFGKIVQSYTTNFREEIVDSLIEEGIIRELVQEPSKDSHTDLSYYVNLAAEYLNMSSETFIGMLEMLNSVYPSAVMTILIKTIANDFKKKHSKDVVPEYYYYISLSDGDVHKVPSNSVSPNFIKYGSLFYSFAEAKEACNIIHDQLKYMYGK